MPRRCYVCANPACGKVFARYGVRHKVRPRFCSQACNATVNRPSQALVIPEGQPMSRSTQQRRAASKRKAQGPA
jgi:hypothetical protein